MHRCRNSKKILPGYLHGSYHGSTHALVARIDHNVEEFDCRYCNSQDQYKIRPDDFSPDKLTQSHRCSRFCLPCFAHCLNNENKLSMEISCQLFWNEQYKLVNNYVWETHIAVELEAYQQGLKCPYCLARCQDHQDPWWEAYPHKNHTSCKVASQFGQPKSITWWVLRWIFFVSKLSWSSKPILSKT